MPQIVQNQQVAAHQLGVGVPRAVGVGPVEALLLQSHGKALGRAVHHPHALLNGLVGDGQGEVGLAQARLALEQQAGGIGPQPVGVALAQLQHRLHLPAGPGVVLVKLQGEGVKGALLQGQVRREGLVGQGPLQLL